MTSPALFSAYIDEKISDRIAGLTPAQAAAELLLMHRTIKVVEEVGEAHQALIAFTNSNPRKPAGTLEDLVKELLDAACAALGAVEHVTGNEGRSMELLEERLREVTARAGLERATAPVLGVLHTDEEQREPEYDVLSDTSQPADRPFRTALA